MIVVDASVLADALIDDGPAGESARAELAADSQWAAPAQLLVEVVSVIRGKVLGGTLGLVRAAAAIGALPQLVVIEVGAGQLVDRRWELRGKSPAIPHGLSGADVGKALVRGCLEHVSTRGSHGQPRQVPGRRPECSSSSSSEPPLSATLLR